VRIVDQSKRGLVIKSMWILIQIPTGRWLCPSISISKPNSCELNTFRPLWPVYTIKKRNTSIHSMYWTARIDDSMSYEGIVVLANHWAIITITSGMSALDP
jgi:hypothetical protein